MYQTIHSLNFAPSLNFALKLWSGCISTAKTLSHGTQSGPNTAASRSATIPGIDAISTNDMIHRKGEEIACHPPGSEVGPGTAGAVATWS